ncbi:MAG: rod shape-determining protein MreC [Myxococcota bacterium]|nr:hypothetical protein [Myxococcales bacterium]MEC7749903.1 rod shape-determining protein MreC [Myxococcota bacterium]HBU48423.1 hypothetical protein [Myxococcales bacterium]
MKTRSWLLIGGLLLTWPLVYLAHARVDQPGPLDRVVLIVTGPIAEVLHRASATFSDWWAERRSLATARQDAYDTWQENRRLRLDLMRLKSRLRRSDRLERLLKLRQASPAVAWVSGEIVFAGIGRDFPRLVASVGREDGVRVGDLVVDDRGVLGRVRQVAGGSSEVMPLTHPRSAIGFEGSRSGSIGMIQGDGSGGLVCIGADPSTPPEEGEMLLTRSLESPLPDGLPIGRVIWLETEPGEGRLLVGVEPVRHPREADVLMVATDPRPYQGFRPVPPRALGQVP